MDPNGWHAAGGGVNSLATGITSAAGWGLETVLTTTLVFIVFCATDAERGSDTAHLPVRVQHGGCNRPLHVNILQGSLIHARALQVLAPFAIGMDVFLCHMVAIPLDGCR